MVPKPWFSINKKPRWITNKWYRPKKKKTTSAPWVNQDNSSNATRGNTNIKNQQTVDLGPLVGGAATHGSGADFFGSNSSFHLTSIKLNGQNDLKWAQSMKLAIDGRGKIDHLTGGVAKPNIGDPKWQHGVQKTP